LLYWTGGLISFTGSWVQSVCYGWLVYEITDSKLWLGIIGFIGALPLSGLTLFGGAIADRVDKRRTLIATQSLFAVFALLLGLLVGAGVIAKHNYPARYYILTIAFLQGIVMSLDAPVRQSMPALLVPKQDLMNAIVLNSAAFNGARVIGPALGGILVAKVGMAPCFYINAASFLAVIAAVVFMRTRPAPINATDSSIFADVMEGLRYVRAEPRIYKLMMTLSVSSLFVMPYVTLMPVFARDILAPANRTGTAPVTSGHQAAVLGALLSSVGIGAVVGALVLAKLSSMPRRGRILLAASAAGSVLLIAFANSRSLIISQAILVGIGFCVVSFNQTTNSLIQHATDDKFRGRVMSAYVFVFMGLSPLANLQAGGLAQVIGAPMTVTIWGIIFMGAAAYLATQNDVLKL
jgi:MFS family permease